MDADLVKNSRISTKWFNSVLESLNAVESPKQLFDIALDIKKQFGFKHIAYGIVIANDFRNEIYYIYSDESEEWKQTYIQNEYWKIDTRIIMARKQIAPFYWSRLPQRSSFISDEMMKGVWDGITIPVHGPKHFFGFLHFTYRAEQKKISSWLQYIKPFVVYLAQRIIEANFALIGKGLLSPLLHNFIQSNTTPFTLQQRRCLAWAAEGKTTEEIALILDISVSTVNKHLDSAAEVLNANNRTHAIAKAVDGNLIALAYKKKSTIFYF
ncbi:helix-turn-helix transcriptional regulator [Methylobacter sp. sgz302048]|jgi:LuxR family transcriptional activator of rhlAB and lasB|uniref:helix-turn-helix transcriptional regulator n=1 Tax=Methylobacter sp. sgz302048 TaxID=3455945 RepID=UPI003FA0C6C0